MLAKFCLNTAIKLITFSKNKDICEIFVILCRRAQRRTILVLFFDTEDSHVTRVVSSRPLGLARVAMAVYGTWFGRKNRDVFLKYYTRISCRAKNFSAILTIPQTQSVYL